MDDYPERKIRGPLNLNPNPSRFQGLDVDVSKVLDTINSQPLQKGREVDQRIAGLIIQEVAESKWAEILSSVKAILRLRMEEKLKTKSEEARRIEEVLKSLEE
ncbi:hypothetical protein E1J53_0018920 [Lewinella sp. W8]|nr:hypothetical protein [Lewinella sp. W8]